MHCITFMQHTYHVICKYSKHIILFFKNQFLNLQVDPRSILYNFLKDPDCFFIESPFPTHRMTIESVDFFLRVNPLLSVLETNLTGKCNLIVKYLKLAFTDSNIIICSTLFNDVRGFVGDMGFKRKTFKMSSIFKCGCTLHCVTVWNTYFVLYSMQNPSLLAFGCCVVNY